MTGGSEEYGSGIRLASDDFWAEHKRCDGCGVETMAATHYQDENGVSLATYCPGCEELRQVRDIEPGGHEQYKLEEVKPRAD